MKRCPDCDMEIETLKVVKELGDMSFDSTWDYKKYDKPEIYVTCSECSHIFDAKELKALGVPKNFIKRFCGKATK